MLVLPPHFLFRLTYPCTHQRTMPEDSDDQLLDLPSNCRIDHFPEMADLKHFADVRLAWNESGLGLQVEIKGKEEEPQSDASRPRYSDGVQLWVDTRDARTIHRASRYCHHFFFLPTGGSPEKDEPAAGQLKINRAQQDAPLCRPDQLAFIAQRRKSGYALQAFLPAAVLNGFDPETNPRLGFFYWVHDAELGDQTLGLGLEFPFWEDPSLWHTLELASSG